MRDERHRVFNYPDFEDVEQQHAKLFQNFKIVVA